jgi:alcohol dehydrogenase class IV
MQLRGNWNYPTTVRFGAGRIAELPEALQLAGITKPLFVTDPMLANMPMTAKAMDLLASAGVSAKLFSDVQPNPVEANVKAGVAAYKAGSHDGVIAFGGGSALDAGKLIAFMKGQTRPVFDFEDVGDWWTRADASAIAPVVAVPTTAGTGSEVGRAAVVTNEATHTKKIIFHPGMLPKVTICDPELTVGMPPVITVGTGMDAFSHALEAYCVPSYHALGDGIAVEGVRLVKEHLAAAVKDGTDIEARAHMMAAAAAGATAFQKGLGAIHALSHPVGALHNTHHGLTNAVFVPYVLAFNRPAIEDKIVRLAAYIGLKPSFTDFFDWVLRLREETHVPHTLAGLKVGPENADKIAQMAPEDPTAGGNPVPLDAAAARRIFDAALEGKL